MPDLMALQRDYYSIEINFIKKSSPSDQPFFLSRRYIF